MIFEEKHGNESQEEAGSKVVKERSRREERADARPRVFPTGPERLSLALCCWNADVQRPSEDVSRCLCPGHACVSA